MGPPPPQFEADGQGDEGSYDGEVECGLPAGTPLAYTVAACMGLRYECVYVGKQGVSDEWGVHHDPKVAPKI